MTTKPDKKSQIQKFKEAALELEADESEKPFDWARSSASTISAKENVQISGALPADSRPAIALSDDPRRPTMTDREIAVATFRAVAALHRALTGKPLSLSVETEWGTIRITEEGHQPGPSILRAFASRLRRASANQQLLQLTDSDSPFLQPVFYGDVGR